MSSILDALKKLEEEKAEAAQSTHAEIEEDVAEHDLVRGAQRRPVTIQLTPGALVAAAAGLLAIIIALGAYVFISRPAAPVVARLESAPTAPLTPMSARAATAKTTNQNSPSSRVRIPTTPPPPSANRTPVVRNAFAPSPKPTPQEPSRRPDTVIAPTIETRVPPAESKPSNRETTSGQTEKPTRTKTLAVARYPRDTPRTHKTVNAAIAAPESPPYHSPKTPRPPAVTAELPTVSAPTKPHIEKPLDMFSLPILTETDKVRLGLKDMEINMLRSPSKDRPTPSAIINMQPVYVNEIIQGTRATLIGVDVRGIAIEIDGKRYFVPR